MSKNIGIVKLTAGLLLTLLITISIIMFSFKVLAQQPNTTNDNTSTPIESRRSNIGETKLEPLDLSTEITSKKRLTNREIVEKELSALTPDQIKTYPLKDIPAEELIIILNNLSVRIWKKHWKIFLQRI